MSTKPATPVIKVSIELPTGFTEDDVEVIFVNADPADRLDQADQSDSSEEESEQFGRSVSLK